MGSRLTANIFFSPSSATQGHQPFTVFCSKRDTNHSGWKVSSSRSREHFSAVLAGLGMRLRSSCKEPVTRRGSLAEGFSVTGSESHPGVGRFHKNSQLPPQPPSMGLAMSQISQTPAPYPCPLIPSIQFPIHLLTNPYAH